MYARVYYNIHIVYFKILHSLFSKNRYLKTVTASPGFLYITVNPPGLRSIGSTQLFPSRADNGSVESPIQ